MRATLTFISVVFIAELFCAAMLLVVSGRGFVYSPGIGAFRGAGSLLQWNVVVSSVGIGLAAVFHRGASVFARHYFHLRWWRDLSLVVAIMAAIVAVAIYVGRVVTYGAL